MRIVIPKEPAATGPPAVASDEGSLFLLLELSR
jgi:hypothetical protein